MWLLYIRKCSLTNQTNLYATDYLQKIYERGGLGCVNSPSTAAIGSKEAVFTQPRAQFFASHNRKSRRIHATNWMINHWTTPAIPCLEHLSLDHAALRQNAGGGTPAGPRRTLNKHGERTQGSPRSRVRALLLSFTKSPEKSRQVTPSEE